MSKGNLTFLVDVSVDGKAKEWLVSQGYDDKNIGSNKRLNIEGESLMVKFAVEAIAYEGGIVQLLEHLRLAKPCRALVTILSDEMPIFQLGTGPTANEPMREPVALENRTIDLAEVSEIYDKGDYIFVNFHSYHQPPYLFLTGQNAEILRTWMNENDDPQGSSTTVDYHLNDQQINDLEQLVMQGKSLDINQTLRLIADLKTIREERDDVIRHTSLVVQGLFDGCENLRQAIATNKVRSVRCHYSEECKVRPDGSCIHIEKHFRY